MLLASLIAYVSIYTWNARTGLLDRFVTFVGLEVVGSVLVPGKWVHSQMNAFWARYIYLVGVRQHNELLQREVDTLHLRLADLREKALQAERLQELLAFEPPVGWQRVGAHVIGHRHGANAVLRSLIVDKGQQSLVGWDAPVIVPQGVVGRIHRPGLHFSSVLLLSDPNSHIPVMGASSRIPAIVVGQGQGQPLRVKYVPLNRIVPRDELLITSGLGGVFPKGLPVARVTGITRSPISLFQDIVAQPMISLQGQEEVLILITDSNATRFMGHESEASGRRTKRAK